MNAITRQTFLTLTESAGNLPLNLSLKSWDNQRIVTEYVVTRRLLSAAEFCRVDWEIVTMMMMDYQRSGQMESPADLIEVYDSLRNI